MKDGCSRPGRETFWIRNTTSSFPRLRVTPVSMWDSLAINERSASLCNARSKHSKVTTATIPKYRHPRAGQSRSLLAEHQLHAFAIQFGNQAFDLIGFGGFVLQPEDAEIKKIHPAQFGLAVGRKENQRSALFVRLTVLPHDHEVIVPVDPALSVHIRECNFQV